MVAAGSMNDAVMLTLLKRGANPNAVNKYDCPFLPIFLEFCFPSSLLDRSLTTDLG